MHMLKFPQWISTYHGDDDMDDDDKVMPPPIAMAPEPTQPDDEATAYGKGVFLYTQLKRKLEALQVDLVEAEQKIAFLEKENGELRLDIIGLQNNNQTLASQRDDDLQFMTTVKRYLDARDIKAVPKKPRNGNGNRKDKLSEATPPK